MTKDKGVYTAQINVVPDPRSKHTAADRKAKFELANKLHKSLGEMTTAVERINLVRLALNERIAKLPQTDALRARLQTASNQVDEIRKKIVATKEGGAITGEERLREYLADLYGNVNGFEGRPSNTQVQRADALTRELADVIKNFDDWAAKELPGINSALAGKQIEQINLPTRVE
jgi:hypothetical protein